MSLAQCEDVAHSEVDHLRVGRNLRDLLLPDIAILLAQLRGNPLAVRGIEQAHLSVARNVDCPNVAVADHYADKAVAAKGTLRNRFGGIACAQLCGQPVRLRFAYLVKDFQPDAVAAGVQFLRLVLRLLRFPLLRGFLQAVNHGVPKIFHSLVFCSGFQ